MQSSNHLDGGRNVGYNRVKHNLWPPLIVKKRLWGGVSGSIPIIHHPDTPIYWKSDSALSISVQSLIPLTPLAWAVLASCKSG